MSASENGNFQAYLQETRWCRQVRGTAVMFLQDEGIAFLKQWQTRSFVSPATGAGEPLMSLDAFARHAGIDGKYLRGIALPGAIKSYGSQLMFSAAAVELFTAEHKRCLSKK